MSTLFIILGFMLAGVGLLPLTVRITPYNIYTAGMAVARFLPLLGSPILPGMPWALLAVTGGFFIAIVGSVMLFAVTGYFNLTFFELVVFLIILGWIATVTRSLDATVPSAQAN